MTGKGEAFVPQAPHLLHLVIEKIRQPAGIEAGQTRKILNYADTGEDVITVEEKIYFLPPNQFRIETLSDHGTRFVVESGSGFVSVVDGVTVSHEKSPMDLYTDILLYRDHESLMNQLTLAGIDTERVSLQRYNDTICYVIGRPLEKGKPFAGLWIEKDSFLPIKYVAPKNGLLVECFYRNWQKISKTFYPMQISIFLDTQLFAMIDVNTIELKSGFALSLFDIEHIEQLYPKKNPDPFDENSRQVEELDKRIEDFKKLYE